MNERIRIRKKNGNEYANKEIWTYNKERKRGYWKYDAYLGKVVGYDEAGNPIIGEHKGDLEEKVYYDLVQATLQDEGFDLLRMLAGDLIKVRVRQQTIPLGQRTQPYGDFTFFRLKSQAPFYYELRLIRTKGHIVPFLSLNLQSDREMERKAATVIQIFDNLEDAFKSDFPGIAIGKKEPSGISVSRMFGYFAYSTPETRIDSRRREIGMCLAFIEMVSWAELYIQQSSIQLTNTTKGLSELLVAMLTVFGGELLPVLDDNRLITILRGFLHGGSVFLRNGKIFQCGMLLQGYNPLK